MYHTSNLSTLKTQNRKFWFLVEIFYVPEKWPTWKNLHLSFFRKNISGEYVSTFFWSFYTKERKSKILNFSKKILSPRKNLKISPKNFFQKIFPENQFLDEKIKNKFFSEKLPNSRYPSGEDVEAQADICIYLYGHVQIQSNRFLSIKLVLFSFLRHKYCIFWYNNSIFRDNNNYHFL